MIAISFEFLSGRYHATPWGRHVNEGVVEWPPSPWRILRAIVATWKRTLPELEESEVKPILEILAAEDPEFELPPASTGHTRHYMPWYKKGPDDRTLVFDAFVAVGRRPNGDGGWRPAPLVAHWPKASLSEAQRDTLARILTNLNTLGRAESWCEAKLLPEGPRQARRVCRPINDEGVSPEDEVVRLLCPDPASAFKDDHVVKVVQRTEGRGKNKQILEERQSIYDPAWNLCMETLQLHNERWSDPPGSRWVQYSRPSDCFKVRPARTTTHTASASRIQVIRFLLDSNVLPLITDTLPVAELARKALMCWHGRLTAVNGVRGRSSILSGKDKKGDPLRGHGHAYYLPTDEDGDGRLDHLTIYAADGFGHDELRAADRLRELTFKDQSHPLRLVLLGMGPADEYVPFPLRPSREWVSATPFIATIHPHRGERRQPIRYFLEKAIRREWQLLAECRKDLPPIAAIEPPDDDHGTFRIDPSKWVSEKKSDRQLRPIQFKRFRQKSGDDGGLRPSGAFRLIFDVPVRGPICIGHSSHFGMGLFLPAVR
ncbi:MAG TPA: type I-U CRISPR-associated protein Csb2 [Phycisphaerae bacterium]|nr:type I-U CRISPR-associated protein Csb2 [Phycisphaerae bacterium]